MTSGIFAILPDNFFSPLASLNREHYASLLVLYYRLFQESTNTRGLERELVVREFMKYLALHRDSLIEDDEEIEKEAAFNAPSGDSSFQREPGVQEFNFDNNSVHSVSEHINENNAANENNLTDERTLASKFLRRFINAGWLAEETLADFTKVINITAWGKPFMKSLADIDGGLKLNMKAMLLQFIQCYAENL